MQAKRKVLAQHPEARLVVVRRYDDTSPRYHAVFVGNKRLDIHEYEGDYLRYQQGAAQAWNSAYYALVREKSAAKEIA